MRSGIIFYVVLHAFMHCLNGQIVIDTVYYSGNPSNRVNFVVLGDGFAKEEINSFKLARESIVNGLLKVQPFDSYKDHFNFFSISTISKESGAASTPDIPIDNYYGSSFGYGGINRLLVPIREEKIFEILSSHFPDYDQVIMIVNSELYGGSGGWIATASMHPSSMEIIVHELGHSFGGLADEYWVNKQYASEKPNMTREHLTDKVKWRNWLGDNDIGIYSFQENSSWKRPHQNCKMRFLRSDFCAVCKETLVEKIQFLTVPVDFYYPDQVYQSQKAEYSIAPLNPIPNTLAISWYLDSFKLPVESDTLKHELLDGKNFESLQLMVWDSTGFSRKDELYVYQIKWDPFTTQTNKYLLSRNELNKLPWRKNKNLEISVAPNPFSTNFSLNIKAFQQQEARFQLFDTNGKLVKTFQKQKLNPGHQQLLVHPRGIKPGTYILREENSGLGQLILKK